MTRTQPGAVAVTALPPQVDAPEIKTPLAPPTKAGGPGKPGGPDGVALKFGTAVETEGVELTVGSAVAVVNPAPTPAPVPRPTPKKAHTKMTVSIANPTPAGPSVQINRSGCEPNERWRAATKANLQEIQQSAASLDKKMWAQFENIEPSIISAIGSASTGVECDAVETKIELLARKFKP